MSLNELAEAIGAEVVGGDPATEISSVATLEDAGPGQVSFLSNARDVRLLEATRASAVIVARQVRSGRVALLRTGDPYYAFSQAVVMLHGYRRHPHDGVHLRAGRLLAATEQLVPHPGYLLGCLLADVIVGPGARSVVVEAGPGL